MQDACSIAADCGAAFAAIGISAAAASPALAGVLFASFPALPRIICGGLKIVYDLLLLMQFPDLKPPEECHDH